MSIIYQNHVLVTKDLKINPKFYMDKKVRKEKERGEKRAALDIGHIALHRRCHFLTLDIVDIVKEDVLEGS